MSGINDSLNWDLLKRQTYTVTTYGENLFNPIPPITLVAESHLFQFGFRNSLAPSHWKFAAIVNMRLLTLPSSTSEFIASVSAYKRPCFLNELAIIQFPNYGMLPFLIEIHVAKWHKELYVEAWQYSGVPIDFPTQSLDALNRIENKIDAL